MIKSFSDKHTRDLFIVGKSRRIHPTLARKAIRRLEYIDLAIDLSDLKVPPSNRLHALSGDRKGQYSISINEQWRICFRFENGNAYDVEITDYH
jgi:proteic killer suppression protein